MDDNEDEIVAVPSLTFDGNEREVSALHIKIKSVNDIEKERIITSIRKNIYFNGAVLSKCTEGAFLAFFNINKRQNNHELLAVKTALGIQNDNKNLKSLIIGFGINSGRVIASDAEKGIIKYTCFGNFVNLSKKLCFRSEHNILFTQNIYLKIFSNIKSDELKWLSDDLNMKIYSLSESIDREKYNNYSR